MKKIIISLVLIISVFLITGCGNNDNKGVTVKTYFRVEEMSFESPANYKYFNHNEDDENYHFATYTFKDFEINIEWRKGIDFENYSKSNTDITRYSDLKVNNIAYKYGAGSGKVKYDSVFEHNGGLYLIQLTGTKNEDTKAVYDKLISSIAFYE